MRTVRWIAQILLMLSAVVVPVAFWLLPDGMGTTGTVADIGRLTWGVLGTALSLGGILGWFNWSLVRLDRRMRLVSEMNIKINRAILLNEDMDLIFDLVLDHIFQIFRNVRFGSILVVDDQGWLSFTAHRGFDAEYVRNFHLKLEDCFLYHQTEGKLDRTCLISARTLRYRVAAFQPDTWQYRSVISAPLYRDGKLFGLLNLDSAQRNLFRPADVLLVDQFRAQIEVCLVARARYEASLQRHHIDALTGLSTRRLFEDLFQLSIERANRYGENFVLALFDADGLKRINDRHGHLAGDQYLLAMADTLRGNHRKSDILGRFGGDEFIALYHGSSINAMRHNLHNLVEASRATPLDIGGEKMRVSFSFGLAQYPGDGTDLEGLIRVADRELYAMKAAHRPQA